MLTAEQVRKHPPVRSIGLVVGLVILLLFAGWFVTAFLLGEFQWIPMPSVLVVGVSCMSVGVLACLVSPRVDRSFLIKVFLIAFLLRVFVALFATDHLLMTPPYTGFEGNDDLYWDLKGRQLAGATSLTESLRDEFSAGYALVNGFVYRWTGPYPINVRIVNALFGAVLPVVGFQLARITFQDKPFARKYASLLMLWPSLVFFSGLQQKDSLVALAVITGVTALGFLYRSRLRIPMLLLFVTAVLVAGSVRTLAGDLLLMVGALAFLLSKRSRTASLGAWLPVSIGIGLVFFVAIRADSWVDIGFLDFQQLYASRQVGIVENVSAVAGRSQGITGSLFQGPLPLRVAVGLVIFFISPFPPSLDISANFAAAILSFFVPLWFLTLPYLGVFSMRSIKSAQWRLYGVLLGIPIGVAALAQAVTFVGTVARQRVMVEPLILLSVLKVYEGSSPNRRFRFLWWSVFVGMCGALIYALLRQI